MTIAATYMRVIGLWLALAWGSQIVIAQDAQPTQAPLDAGNEGLVNAFLLTNNERPRLGEPFILTLVVEAPNTVDQVELPIYPDGEDLQVIDYGDIERTESGESVQYRQQMTAVKWELDDYLTAPLFVTYRANGQVFSSAVQSVAVFVEREIDNYQTAERRATLAQIDLDVASWQIPIAIAIVALATFMIVLLLLQIALRGVQRTIAPGSPAQVAIAQLEDIRAQALPAESAYPLIASALRGYLREYYQIDIGELTTYELMTQINESQLLQREQRTRLHQLLDETDLVKFAAVEPTHDDQNRLLQNTMQWLRDDERIEEKKRRDGID